MQLSIPSFRCDLINSRVRYLTTPRWALGSEHQQVEVWPLVGRTDPESEPLLSVALEAGGPLLTMSHKLQKRGWRCLVAFLPYRPDVVACTGLTRQRRLVLFDVSRRCALAYLALEEWMVKQ